MTSIKWLAVAAFSVIAPAANAQIALTGAGKAVPGGGGGCSPFSYAASPVYQSLDFADTWSTTQATLTPNAVSSPACSTTGATIAELATTNFHEIQKGITVGITARTYTATSWAQRVSGTRNYSFNINDSGFASAVTANVDLGTCTGQSSFAFGNYSLTSATVTSVAGWCKVVVVYATSATDTAIIPQLFATDASFASNYLGTGGSIAVWGFDLR